MYTYENYLWGLAAYYLGATLALLCLYHFRTLLPWKHFRNLLLIFVAVVILTPVTAYPDTDFLAPAWFVSIYALMLGENEEMIRALAPLLILTPFALTGYLALCALIWKRRGGKTTKR